MLPGFLFAPGPEHLLPGFLFALPVKQLREQWVVTEFTELPAGVRVLEVTADGGLIVELDERCFVDTDAEGPSYTVTVRVPAGHPAVAARVSADLHEKLPAVHDVNDAVRVPRTAPGTPGAVAFVKALGTASLVGRVSFAGVGCMRIMSPASGELRVPPGGCAALALKYCRVAQTALQLEVGGVVCCTIRVEAVFASPTRRCARR